jgi:hypothetical protein
MIWPDRRLVLSAFRTGVGSQSNNAIMNCASRVDLSYMTKNDAHVITSIQIIPADPNFYTSKGASSESRHLLTEFVDGFEF